MMNAAQRKRNLARGFTLVELIGLEPTTS